jgi:hypothetical protein
MTSKATVPDSGYLERPELAREIRVRATRAMRILNGGVVERIEGDAFAVHSGPHVYRVDLRAELCDCPDAEYNARQLGIACKHVQSAAMTRATRRSGVAVKSISGAGDGFHARGSRRLHELRDIALNDSDEETREAAREELLRLRGRS